MSGAVKFKHKSTNPSLTGKDKVMRAYQNLEAKLTGTTNARASEDLRQLRDLADTIKPASSQQNELSAKMT